MKFFWRIKDFGQEFMEIKERGKKKKKLKESLSKSLYTIKTS